MMEGAPHVTKAKAHLAFQKVRDLTEAAIKIATARALMKLRKSLGRK